jgi:hypothetical protein
VPIGPRELSTDVPRVLLEGPDDAFDALSMAILNEPRWEEATKIEIERQCNGTSLL